MVFPNCCQVLPTSAHTVKSAASNFLLNWLFQHEHEHRQWSAAMSLGLITTSLHVTDHKQNFENINGLLKVLCKSRSTLVKGACGVSLGFSCEDLLTGVDDSVNKVKEHYKLQEGWGIWCHTKDKKNLIISWIPHVDVSLLKHGFLREEHDKVLSVGSCLVLTNIVAFCLKVEMMDSVELDHLLHGYEKLITELLNVKYSGFFMSSWALSFLRNHLWSHETKTIDSTGQHDSDDSRRISQSFLDDSLVVKLSMWILTLNYVEFPLVYPVEGVGQYHGVLKKIQAKARLARMSSMLELGKLKSYLLNSNSDGIWNVEKEVQRGSG
ncbi:Protein RST1 [Linum perenne]